MLSVLFASIIGAEIWNYVHYKRLSNYVSQEKNHVVPADQYNHEWMEKYISDSLSPDEIINWINNSIAYSYAQINNNTEQAIVPLEEIPREHMINWTCYHLYYDSPHNLNGDQLDKSQSLLDKIENKINFAFKKITNPDLFFLKFGHNKIRSEYKPLIVYHGFNLVKNAVYAYLKYHGFTKHKLEKSGIVYFTYIKDENKTTTMFIHGLGFGITPYLSFLMEMKDETNLILPVLPNISNMEFCSMFDTVSEEKLFPSYETIREDFKEMVTSPVNVIAHSFGTIILSVLLRDPYLNETIKKRIFIDPVCFIDDCHKIYKYIDNPDDHGGGIINNIFNAFVYKDIYVRYATQRFLYGPEFWIFDYDNLSNDNNLIILSENDKIVPAHAIYNRLRKHGIPCIMVHDARHAEIFIDSRFSDVIEKLQYHIIHYINE